MNLSKRLLILLMSVLFVTFYGCNSDEDENITTSDFIGVWEITAASADLSVGESSLLDYLVNTLQLSQIEAQAFETLMSEGITEGLGGTVEFKSDNTYVAEFGDDPAETGTWQYIEAGMKMSLLETGEDQPTEFDVISISSTKLDIAIEESESEDLDDDGMPEEITILFEMTLTKQ